MQTQSTGLRSKLFTSNSTGSSKRTKEKCPASNAWRKPVGGAGTRKHYRPVFDLRVDDWNRLRSKCDARPGIVRDSFQPSDGSGAGCSRASSNFQHRKPHRFPLVISALPRAFAAADALRGAPRAMAGHPGARHWRWMSARTAGSLTSPQSFSSLLSLIDLKQCAPAQIAPG